jgi:hypothetical protein
MALEKYRSMTSEIADSGSPDEIYYCPPCPACL